MVIFLYNLYIFCFDITLLGSIFKLSYIQNRHNEPSLMKLIMNHLIMNHVIMNDVIKRFQFTLQPFYNMVCYNMVLDKTRFKDGSQKCLDYIEK